VPLYGDGRSGTLSSLPSQFGGYKRSLSQPAPDTQPGLSRLVSQPSPPPAGGSGNITFVNGASSGVSGSQTTITPPAVTVQPGDFIITVATASSGVVTGWGALARG
jgi:hypothetical protein